MRVSSTELEPVGEGHGSDEHERDADPEPSRRADGAARVAHRGGEHRLVGVGLGHDEPGDHVGD